MCFLHSKNNETATDECPPANMSGLSIVPSTMAEPNAEAFNPDEHAYPIGPLLTEADAKTAVPLFATHSMAPDHELR